jgi:hypothetical protein
MSKQISFDTKAIGQALRNIGSNFKVLFAEKKRRLVAYFLSITTLQQYSWMAIGGGVVFVILALILW